MSERKITAQCECGQILTIPAGTPEFDAMLKNEGIDVNCPNCSKNQITGKP
jgi:hypothetical protein